jgi:hypothetical protein
MSKYNAKKVIVTPQLEIIDHKTAKETGAQGILFDSRAEALYYIELIEKKENGEILDFTLQPKYILQPAFEKKGKKYQPITYSADFEILHHNMHVEVVDVKGMPLSQQGALRIKMFHYHYPQIELKLLKYVKKYGGWITLDEYNKLKREARKEKKSEGKA